MNEEPARLIALISAAVTALIGLGAILDWYDEEVAGALVIVAGAWIAVAGEIIRSRVWPNAHVREIIEACDPIPPAVPPTTPPVV